MREQSILTKREIEVMILIAKGEPNKAIAKQLGISENTVEQHLRHIYEKLNVRSRTGAALTLLANEQITEIRD